MILEPGAAVRFIGASETAVPGGFAIFGAGYDCTASFRPGSRFGPAALRTASDGLETYSPLLDADLEDLDYADLGDVPAAFGPPEPTLEHVRRAAAELSSAGHIPVMIGGEHSLTPAAFHAVREVHPSVALVQLDAHADLREHYLDQPNSHACAMRRSIEGADTELVQFGIRSGTRDEWRWMRANDTLVDLDGLTRWLAERDGPIYVTVDIDVFDPALVPGTGTPEPGGISWPTFERIATALAASPAAVVGFDVMELAPRLDPTGVSDVVAAKVVRELMLAARG